METEKVIAHIEALLFALGRPLSRAELAKMTDAPLEDIERAISQLQGSTEVRGITLIDDGKMVELRTVGDAAPLIERVRKLEYSRELGRAGAEVVAILLYRGACTRAQIDFIRGVNSTQALRTLAMRGLVRRTESGRNIVWELTGDLLGALGIKNEKDAPEYESVREKLQALEKEAASGK